ncbi:unnamed protein product [Mytilus edulis]|uniref:Uncharacterized protein n=1 Tax=Mytilus edulis TaxID=6550 RepID=A0A8S3S9A0_MYTED|nr:unnamed protein product [Mytilus edulis]
MISELVNGINQKVNIDYSNLRCYSDRGITALSICCKYGDLNLAKWCVDSHCHGNIYEKHYKMCALFMLVVFNNHLKEQALINEEHKVKDVIMSFGRNHVYGDIPAKLLRDVLDTSMHEIVPMERQKYDIDDIFKFGIEIPDVCVIIYVKDFFEKISKSKCVEACLHENVNKKNKTFHATLSKYLNTITRDEVENLIREASSDFISRMLVISGEDIKDESFGKVNDME